MGKRKSQGLGDSIEKFTEATGIKAGVDKLAEAIGFDCGCEKRKEVLNKLFLTIILNVYQLKITII